MLNRLYLILLVTSFLHTAITNAQQFFANTRYGKRQEIGQSTKKQFDGSRQSRSQEKTEIAARNDRFFIGSRYGKRAGGFHEAQIFGDLDNEYNDSELRKEWDQISSLEEDNQFFRLSQDFAVDEKLAMKGNLDIEDEMKYEGKDLKSKKTLICSYTGISSLYQCHEDSGPEGTQSTTL